MRTDGRKKNAYKKNNKAAFAALLVFNEVLKSAFNVRVEHQTKKEEDIIDIPYEEIKDEKK